MNQVFRILVTDGLAQEGLSKLKDIPHVEVIDANGIAGTELSRAIRDAAILIVRSRTEVNEELLKQAPKLKLVIRAGIGLDNVDVPAATDHGVVVMNAPTGNIVTTAEHTIAMLFSVSRKIPQADASLRQGKWEKKKFQGNEICGKTLGIVGLGNIGKAVADRAIGFGMKVIGHDPYLAAEAAAKRHIRLVDLDSLLRQADYITIHVPLTDSTRHLIGKEAFKKMKPSAYLINCARGGIVDEMALVEALGSKLLTGCALDVFEQEPLPKDHPLLKREDIILTPHLGASTDEAQTQVSLEVAEQVRHFVLEGAYRNAVNVPNISIEQLNVLKPYMQLGEKIGAFAAQVTPLNIQRLRIRFEGHVSSYNLEVLTLSVLKGFLTPLISMPVNFVNARNLIKERGIRVEESFDDECADYASLVELAVEGATQSFTCSGTIFGKTEPRIVSIDRFNIDATPSGCLLFTRNTDVPGLIGKMGTLLGTHGINIARMHLGRKPDVAEAIALINIDSKAPASVLESLAKIDGMLSVKQIELL